MTSQTILNRPGSFIYAHPVVGLKLTGKKRRIRIGAGQVLSQRALHLQLRSLRGFTAEVKRFVSEHETFVVVPTRGQPKSAARRAEHYANTMIRAVAATLVGHSSRRNRRFALLGYGTPDASETLIIDKRERRSIFNYARKGYLIETQLGDRWHRHLSATGKRFMLRPRRGIESKFSRVLWRAVGLLGRSHLSLSRSEAFLNCMFSLEVLLSDRYASSKSLKQRVIGLFGWTCEYLEDEFDHLCDLRGHVVHDGGASDVRAEDLWLVELYAKNVVLAACQYSGTWKNRGELRRYCDRCAALNRWPLRPPVSWTQGTFRADNYSELVD